MGVFVFIGYHVISKIKYKNAVAEHIKTIPNFEYHNCRGGIFTRKNLKKDSPTLFIYFNTECEFCNEEAQMIDENIEKFKDIQLVFISFEKPELITAFAERHHLDHYDTINFLSDTTISFATTFDVKSLPSLVLYDKNQQLIEKIKGQTKVEILIKKLRG